MGLYPHEDLATWASSNVQGWPLVPPRSPPSLDSVDPSSLFVGMRLFPPLLSKAAFNASGQRGANEPPSVESRGLRCLRLIECTGTCRCAIRRDAREKSLQPPSIAIGGKPGIRTQRWR